VGRLSEHRKIINHLGKMSYSIYLNHYVIGMVLVWWLFCIKLPAPVVFVVSVLCVLSLSTAIMWLERRVQNAISGRFPRPAPNGAKLATQLGGGAIQTAQPRCILVEKGRRYPINEGCCDAD
jgi:peptidoglycan/LPS O-acetylase OafA/YrhL